MYQLWGLTEAKLESSGVKCVCERCSPNGSQFIRHTNFTYYSQVVVGAGSKTAERDTSANDKMVCTWKFGILCSSEWPLGNYNAWSFDYEARDEAGESLPSLQFDDTDKLVRLTSALKMTTGLVISITWTAQVPRQCVDFLRWDNFLLNANLVLLSSISPVHSQLEEFSINFLLNRVLVNDGTPMVTTFPCISGRGHTGFSQTHTLWKATACQNSWQITFSHSLNWHEIGIIQYDGNPKKLIGDNRNMDYECYLSYSIHIVTFRNLENDMCKWIGFEHEQESANLLNRRYLEGLISFLR